MLDLSLSHVLRVGFPRALSLKGVRIFKFFFRGAVPSERNAAADWICLYPLKLISYKFAVLDLFAMPAMRLELADT